MASWFASEVSFNCFKMQTISPDWGTGACLKVSDRVKVVLQRLRERHGHATLRGRQRALQQRGMALHLVLQRRCHAQHVALRNLE